MQLVDRILDHARQQPGAPAILGPAGTVTYAALLGEAGALAARFAAADPEGDRRPVALMMAKSPRMAVAMLAALLAGRAYVPVDPGHPAPRRAEMIADSRAALVVVDEATDAADIAAVAGDAQVIRADMPGDTAAFTAPIPADPADDAAILYTSGSTSRPKGVRLSRRAFDIFTGLATDYLALGPADRIASHAPFGFDISILDLFAGLAAGASVHLVPEGQMSNGRFLTSFIADRGITVWQSVPTAICAIARETAARQAAGDPSVPIRSLRHVGTTGEPLPAACRGDLSAVNPHATLHNIYGCTETNDSVIFSIPVSEAAGEGQLPIGTPLPFADCRIVDDQRRDVARGETGELMVASATAFTGYTDPELTAAALVRLADGSGPYYATRDLVVQDGDGILHFVGRVDHTIKLRGVRIDLREVEAALAAAFGQPEVVALTVPCAVRGRQLVGVLGGVMGGRTDAAPLSPIELKKRCAAHLPRLAIPDRFVSLSDILPRNANGKIDRRRVADMVAALPGTAAPSDESIPRKEYLQ